MRKFKELVLVVAFIFSGSTFASTDPGEDVKSSNPVTEKIVKLLGDLQVDLKDDAMATVVLTVNKDNEIVVLSIDSEVESIKRLIKSRINYQKLDRKFDKSREIYSVPVTILKG